MSSISSISSGNAPDDARGEPEPDRFYGVEDEGATYPAILQPTDWGWRLKFGAGGCVTFSVYYPRVGERLDADRAIIMEELSVAQLEGVNYRPDCSAGDEDMERGGGTIAMLWSAMKLLKVLFPDVTGATFKDTSRTDCAAGTSVSLKHSYLARHPATWYMRHFGAEPGRSSSSEVMAAIARGKAKMDSRPQEDFDVFFEAEVVDLDRRVRVKDFKEVLRRNFSGDESLSPAGSYREFVQRLNDIDCMPVMIESWIARFVNKTFGIAAYDDELIWRIAVPDVAKSPTFKVTLRGATDDAFLTVLRVGGGDHGGVEESMPRQRTWTRQKNFSQLRLLDVPRLMHNA